MKLLYERDLQSMKLTILKGTRQNDATVELAKRLCISRQAMRKILIANCDMMTLENLGPRIEAANKAAESDSIENALSLPHLTTGTGVLTKAAAQKYRTAAENGALIETLIQKIVEEIS